MILRDCFIDCFRFIHPAQYKISNTSWCHPLVLAVMAQAKLHRMECSVLQSAISQQLRPFSQSVIFGACYVPRSQVYFFKMTPTSPVRNHPTPKNPSIFGLKEASPSISIRRSACLSGLGGSAWSAFNALGWIWFPMISTQQKTTWKTVWPGKHVFFVY